MASILFLNASLKDKDLFLTIEQTYVCFGQALKMEWLLGVLAPACCCPSKLSRLETELQEPERQMSLSEFYRTYSF